MLNSNMGAFWDVLELDIDVPADATEITAQVFSRDDNTTGLLPASLAWIACTMAIDLPPACGDGQIDPGNDETCAPPRSDWWE
jgi:hypothetical protein